MRYKLLSAFLFFVILSVPAFAQQRPLKVVATQTIFADLVRQVGGDRVSVSAVASPKYNVHFIQPKPSDVRKVINADLYVSAGLDLEAWSDPLLEAAGKPRLMHGAAGHLDLSEGVPLLNVPETMPTRAQGDIHLFGNPHYHMDPQNVKVMARAILVKLKEIDPGYAAYYEKNAGIFLAKLDDKIAAWKKLCAHCRGKEVIAYHDDVAYFVRFIGVRAERFIEPKPGIPPTAKHLKSLEEHAAAQEVSAIIMPTYYPRAQAEQLGQKLGVKVVTICQGAGELPGTEDVFGFFDRNIRQISEALL